MKNLCAWCQNVCPHSHGTVVLCFHFQQISVLMSTWFQASDNLFKDTTHEAGGEIWIWSTVGQSSLLRGVKHSLLEATLYQKVPALMVSRSCEGKRRETQLKAHYLQRCPELPLLTPFRTVSWRKWFFALTERDCSFQLPCVNDSTSVHLHFQI